MNELTLEQIELAITFYVKLMKKYPDVEALNETYQFWLDKKNSFLRKNKGKSV